MWMWISMEMVRKADNQAESQFEIGCQCQLGAESGSGSKSVSSGIEQRQR